MSDQSSMLPAMRPEVVYVLLSVEKSGKSDVELKKSTHRVPGASCRHIGKSCAPPLNTPTHTSPPARYAAQVLLKSAPNSSDNTILQLKAVRLR